MVVKVTVVGANNVIKMMGSLPTHLNKEIMKKMERFSQFMKNSMVQRVPRATGQLAESIKITKGKRDFKVTVNSPYGLYQEEGFAPHPIHRNQHSRAGYRFSDWLQLKGYNRKGDWFIVRKNTPFVLPALREGLNRLPHMLSDGTKKAIKKAGG